MSRKKQREFLRLYEPVHDQFERFCRARAYGEGDHRDWMHETLVVAYERFETLQSEKAFFSFLVGICIRLLANNNKRKDLLQDLRSSFGVHEKLLMRPPNKLPKCIYYTRRFRPCQKNKANA